MFKRFFWTSCFHDYQSSFRCCWSGGYHSRSTIILSTKPSTTSKAISGYLKQVNLTTCSCIQTIFYIKETIFSTSFHWLTRRDLFWNVYISTISSSVLTVDMRWMIMAQKMHVILDRSWMMNGTVRSCQVGFPVPTLVCGPLHVCSIRVALISLVIGWCMQTSTLCPNWSSSIDLSQTKR